jgi:hypothetical protein
MGQNTLDFLVLSSLISRFYVSIGFASPMSKSLGLKRSFADSDFETAIHRRLEYLEKKRVT